MGSFVIQCEEEGQEEGFTPCPLRLGWLRRWIWTCCRVPIIRVLVSFFMNVISVIKEEEG